jgi:hypothetical protein
MGLPDVTEAGPIAPSTGMRTPDPLTCPTARQLPAAPATGSLHLWAPPTVLRLTLRLCRRPDQRCTASPGRPRTATACPAGLTTTGADPAGTSGPHHSQRDPKRLTLDLSPDDHAALLGARYADRLPMADRIRALVSL